MTTGTDETLAGELEALRGNPSDDFLVAMQKMHSRVAFMDKHFDAILAALSPPEAVGEAVELAERFERIATSGYDVRNKQTVGVTPKEANAIAAALASKPDETVALLRSEIESLRARWIADIRLHGLPAGPKGYQDAVHCYLNGVLTRIDRVTGRAG